MISHGLSRRYAQALFHLDSTHGRLEQRLVDFKSLIQILKDAPKLVKFLKAPQVTLQDKKQVLQNVLKGRFDTTFMNFLFYLIQKDRIIHLEHIAEQYHWVVSEHLALWEADVVTALPIDPDSEMKLKEKLEKYFHKKIHLNKKIDPSILGGVILVIGNKMLDWSIANRLKKLKNNLIRTQI